MSLQACSHNKWLRFDRMCEDASKFEKCIDKQLLHESFTLLAAYGVSMHDSLSQLC